jgi:hypothetical protein
MKKEIFKDLVTLKQMNLSNDVKKKLRKEARRWREFIIFDRGEDPRINNVDVDLNVGRCMDYDYHTGEISFIEFFFNLDTNRKIKTKSRGKK